MALLSLAPDLWIADDLMRMSTTSLPLGLPRVPLPFRGTTRMTVVRLRAGLLVHSPVRPLPALVDEVRALGDVALVVAPCVMHTSYARAWHAAFPNAKLHVAPRTHKRDASFAGVAELSDDAPLSDELPQVLMTGHRGWETVFLHPPSRTLITTDLVYGVGRATPMFERAYLRLNGVRDPFGTTGYSRKAVTKPDAFAAALRRVLAWDFERVVMSHGPVVERDGRAVLARTWA
jgi:hypothetical protein